MKVAFVEKRKEKKKIKIPEIGQTWKHKHMDEIYMRINNKSGAMAKGHNVEEKEEYFYSVDLKCGDIRFSDKEDDSIVLLEPVGGEVHFNEIKEK